MSVPREQLVARVKEWIEYAEDDLRAARHLMDMPDCPDWMVAYHAEQGAEKALKAFLVFKAVDFPPTHNITMLRELCSEFGDWATELSEADELTRYGTAARYPALVPRCSDDELKRIVKIADNVFRKVTNTLGELGLEDLK